jgi:hypothetical protein
MLVLACLQIASASNNNRWRGGLHTRAQPMSSRAAIRRRRSRPGARVQQRPVEGGLIWHLLLDQRTEPRMDRRPNSGGELKVMAAIQEALFIERIIKLLGAADPGAAQGTGA